MRNKLFFTFLLSLFADSLLVKVKSPSSPALREICSVTFDVADAESSSSRPGVVVAEDFAAHQRKPEQSQTDKETQTIFVGAQDVISPYETENTAADQTNMIREEDAGHEEKTPTEAETTENAEVMTCASDEKEENAVLTQPHTTKETEPEPAGPSEGPRHGSVASPEPLTPATGMETMNKEGVADIDDEDTLEGDVGIRTEKSGDEWVELKDELKNVDEAAENPEESCSAEPDSRTVLCKHSEMSSKTNDDRVQTRGSRSHRYLKVLQPPIVALLKS